MSFSHLTRCMQLSDTDIAQGLESRADCKRLLDRLSAISKPNDGAPKLLMLFARLATNECDWLDGELRIEVVGDEEACVVEVMSDLGGGLRERVFPAFVMHAPLLELTRAVERVPRVIAPLTDAAQDRAADRLRRPARTCGATSSPPPMIQIDDSSLYANSVPAPGGLPQDDDLFPPPNLPKTKLDP